MFALANLHYVPEETPTHNVWQPVNSQPSHLYIPGAGMTGKGCQTQLFSMPFYDKIS